MQVPVFCASGCCNLLATVLFSDRRGWKIGMGQEVMNPVLDLFTGGSVGTVPVIVGVTSVYIHDHRTQDLGSLKHREKKTDGRVFWLSLEKT